MSVDALVKIIHHPPQNWTDENRAAFEKLFGAPDGRYPKAAEKTMTVRAPEFGPETGVTFAAYIHPSNPTRGAYGGLSFVIFPVVNGPCLVSLGVGRKVRAIAAWRIATLGRVLR